jgi:hypothetical protein
MLEADGWFWVRAKGSHQISSIPPSLGRSACQSTVLEKMYQSVFGKLSLDKRGYDDGKLHGDGGTCRRRLVERLHHRGTYGPRARRFKRCRASRPSDRTLRFDRIPERDRPVNPRLFSRVGQRRSGCINQSPFRGYFTIALYPSVSSFCRMTSASFLLANGPTCTCSR